MQTINQLTENLTQQTTLMTSDSKQELNTATHSEQVICEPSSDLLNLVIDLFEDWKRVFGSKLKERQALDLRTAELWSIALQGLKITPREFKFAWSKSLNLEWSPATPKDFYNLACSEKYISAEQAFQIACQESGKMPEARKWTDSVIYESARRCGTKTLANCTKAFLAQFKRIYEQVIAEHKAGKEFTIPKPVTNPQITREFASSEFVDELFKKYGYGKKTA